MTEALSIALEDQSLFASSTSSHHVTDASMPADFACAVGVLGGGEPVVARLVAGACARPARLVAEGQEQVELEPGAGPGGL